MVFGGGKNVKEKSKKQNYKNKRFPISVFGHTCLLLIAPHALTHLGDAMRFSTGGICCFVVSV